MKSDTSHATAATSPNPVAVSISSYSKLSAASGEEGGIVRSCDKWPAS